MRYDRLALNQIPSASEVAVGSLVIFPQGVYVGTDGKNTGGLRYHQGLITSVHTDAQGVARYNGHHTLGIESRMKFRSFNHNFADLALDDLRMPPNVSTAHAPARVCLTTQRRLIWHKTVTKAALSNSTTSS